MLNARNQVRWYEEEWRRKNEVESESEEVVVKESEEVVVKESEEVVVKESEEVVVKEEDEEAAKIAENLAKHVEKLRKYFARTTESTTMEIPVHRQKATR